MAKAAEQAEGGSFCAWSRFDVEEATLHAVKDRFL